MDRTHPVVVSLHRTDRHSGQAEQDRRTVLHARGPSHQLLQTQPVSRGHEPSAHNTKIVSHFPFKFEELGCTKDLGQGLLPERISPCPSSADGSARSSRL